MRIAVLLALALLAACGSTDGSADQGLPVDSDDTDAPVLPEPPEDTGFPPGDEGSLMLVRRLLQDGSRTVELYGTFVDEHAGYHNLAHCAVTGGLCFDFLPDVEDGFLPIDLTRVFEPEFSAFRYVGLDVGLGAWSAPYINGPVMPYYYADLSEQLALEDIRGDYGVRFGGQWGDYQGTEDIYISPDLDLISPKPNARIQIHDGGEMVVEWVPDGKGLILLSAIEQGNNPTLARQYLLEDDGYFALPVNDLGFATEDETVSFKLARWNFGSVDKWGNHLEIVASSEVSFSADFVYTGGREEIEPPDKCLAATTMPALEAGNYWGVLKDAGYKDDYDDTSECTDGLLSDGQEGFLRVELAPLEFLSATLTLLDEDAAVYIITDCANEETCLDGSNENDATVAEAANYFNETDETQVVYIGLDGTSSTAGVFNLDVNIDPLVEPEMYDTCPELQQSQTTPMGSGSYFTSYLPYTPGLDPTAAGCTGTSLTGPDSMTAVTLLAGETLSATITMEGADPALYLTFDCNNAFSCQAGMGVDASVGKNETLNYTNASGVSENLYLVVDTRGPSLRPYFLTVDIN